MTPEQKIKDFLDRAKWPDNQWVYLPALHLEVYLRYSRRLVRSKQVDCVDIASIGVQERFRGQGFCTQLFVLVEAEADARGLFVFVENSQHDYMNRWYLRRGYLPYQDTDNCFIRHPKPKGSQQ